MERMIQIPEEQVVNMDRLPADQRQNLRGIIAGEIIPPLYADVIAKRLLNLDVHPDRLNFLMRSIAKDESIDVASSSGNENFKMSLNSKNMITDIQSWLRDGRLSDLEVQRIEQDFIFTRIELYASNMLILQYSVEDGQKKSELNYSNVNGVLLIVLMVESPKAFKDFDKTSGRYIHRFTQMTADTGLSYPTTAKIIYVQLDKCLKQFQAGVNEEAKDGKPDELQLWLAMIADVNDEKVTKAAEEDGELQKIRTEAFDMAQDKEVQSMLIQESFERMDILSYGDARERKGKQEGFEEGEEKGEENGRKKERSDLFNLMTKLYSAGRGSDIERMVKDKQYCEKLIKEFQIS